MWVCSLVPMLVYLFFCFSLFSLSYRNTTFSYDFNMLLTLWILVSSFGVQTWQVKLKYQLACWITSFVCLKPHHLEKAMAPHSSTLAWKILWTEEPGRLQSMGSLRVGHDWATSLWLFTFMHWRRKWQLTPVLLPGESQGWGSPVGGRLWSRTELDVTEAT